MSTDFIRAAAAGNTQTERDRKCAAKPKPGAKRRDESLDLFLIIKVLISATLTRL